MGSSLWKRWRLAAALIAGVSGAASAQVVNNGGAVATSLDVRTLTTGTVLDVTPTVSPDGRYVTLRMQPAFSSLEGIDTFTIPGVPGGAPVIGLGGVQAAPRLPELDRMLKAPAVVPDSLRQAPRVLAFDPAKAGVQAPPKIETGAGVIFVENDKRLLGAKTPAMKLASGGSLAEATRQISSATRTNLVLSVRAFQQAGIDTRAPLTVDLPAGTLRDTLDGLLKAGAPGQPLVVTAEDNVVTITTQAQADHAVVTKTYYMEDLLKNAPLWMDRAAGAGAGEKLQQSGDKNGSTNLLELITSTVRPEIWKSNGGKVGEIFQLDNRITIKAPQSVHATLEGPKHYNPNAAPLYVNYGQ